ncbi:hypothetical protein GCM10009715_27360 [Paeniglutamicibacter psychrophenolicus]|uniref:ParB-like chromosome segregation protein Spo0J n=1 Tax=Paeniglutamicibacter psychrophenolicus TaxID=257454 RepID=A0ABS4WEY5_9MICC|nr:hypothetical protein [Paeniglutamicibacter psychrophenolicus]MBP2374688.1 ParB-like chromosome segregation protein Spo0J [Paeniglutamicibacter psychrophenolicus]
MEKPLQPLYDDEHCEVNREIFWGQKELGQALGITAVHVGDLLRSVGLLMPEGKDATPEALDSQAAIYATVKTADGFHRYPRWNKDLVLEPLARALRDMPKPLPRNRPQAKQPRSVTDSSQSLVERVALLERRLETLERALWGTAAKP